MPRKDFSESSIKRGLGRHNSSPNTIEEYEADPEKAGVKDFTDFKMKLDVVGIVRKGTRLRTIRLDKHKGWSWWFGNVETLTPWAEILDGEYSGKIVNITDISIYYRQSSGKGIFLYRPEEGIIEPSNK